MASPSGRNWWAFLGELLVALIIVHALLPAEEWASAILEFYGSSSSTAFVALCAIILFIPAMLLAFWVEDIAEWARNRKSRRE